MKTYKTMSYVISQMIHAETILFVHGLGGNASQYEYQMEYFKDSYNVVSVNLRGHGSTNAHGVVSFALEDMCDDIVVLLDSLKIKKVHFVGHSMGGNIGYIFIQKYQNYCNSLTTFGTTAKLSKSYLSIAVFTLFVKYIPMTFIAKLASLSGKTPYSKKKIYEMISKTPKKTMLKILPNLATIDATKTLKANSSTPYLILRGGFDHEINRLLARSAILMYDNIAVADIKNAGHYANLDAPCEFNQALDSFFTSLAKPLND